MRPRSPLARRSPHVTPLGRRSRWGTARPPLVGRWGSARRKLRSRRRCSSRKPKPRTLSPQCLNRRVSKHLLRHPLSLQPQPQQHQPQPQEQPLVPGSEQRDWPKPTQGELKSANQERHYELLPGAIMGLTIEAMGIHDAPVFDSDSQLGTSQRGRPSPTDLPAVVTQCSEERLPGRTSHGLQRNLEPHDLLQPP